MIENRTLIKKLIWYGLLASVVAAQVYIFVLLEQSTYWTLMSLLFVAFSLSILHGFIFRRPIHMGGFTVSSENEVGRYFCLFVAIIFLIGNFSHQLTGHG